MPPPLITMDPGQRAEVLRRALEEYGIACETHHGYGLALVLIRTGLVVWCDGWSYWWQVGWNAERKRVTCVRHSTTEPDRAARRVAFRYAELRRRHPLAEVAGNVS